MENHGESPFLMEKITINDHFQWLHDKLPGVGHPILLHIFLAPSRRSRPFYSRTGCVGKVFDVLSVCIAPPDFWVNFITTSLFSLIGTYVFFFSRGIIPFYGRTLQVKYCHLPRYLMIFESSIHMAVQRLMCRGGLCARAGQVEIKVGEWQGISHGNS